MIIESLILSVAAFISGIAISRACKNGKEPVINNHYGDINNNTNSNNMTNSHNTDNRHHTTDTEKILKEIEFLLNQKDKENELKEMLRKNDEIISKYK